ncbi:MAG: amylo-alpha-1,6-glucosidase [Bacteroidales bacterium]|nr:amylo-alpha-1,6-glucosidase [Bacteroidales bacterium]
MAFLKFNKQELVNLNYSLKREIIAANKSGAYCNTTIVGCNTRRYHGLLCVPVDNFGGQEHLLLSSVDETLVEDGMRFNLGIHRYGDLYDPRGHKYIIDYEQDPIPAITYKVGEVIIKKELLLMHDKEQLLIRYTLVEAPSKVNLLLRPFLAFRNIHSLTSENPQARTTGTEVASGMAYRMYDGFPTLYLQMNTTKATYTEEPCWYKNITYSDERRRGFPCTEDLMAPGWFSVELRKDKPVILSASTEEIKPAGLTQKYEKTAASAPKTENPREVLEVWADVFKRYRNGRKQITAGFSWLYTGLLRETLFCLPSLTLHSGNDKSEFEEILDNLIEDNEERLYRRTTQIEAPLNLVSCLQAYITVGADPKKVWAKYGSVVKGILESYLPEHRKEASVQPNGLIWAQAQDTCLTWMNAYIDGKPVNERPGFQVEVNGYWYNSICFALECEKRRGAVRSAFYKEFTRIKGLIEENFEKTFWNPRINCLADYVGVFGQSDSVRPNQLLAIALPNTPVSDETIHAVMNVVDKELVTRRGIRTLSPRDERYKSVYEGTQTERDLAYHRGSAYLWLLLPYVGMGFKMMGSSFMNKAEWLIKGCNEDLNKHGVGAYSELYDGDPPHEPHGAISSAMSVAAILAIYDLMDRYREDAK